nr:hypothetical protein [Tanacetum cinerariifolium]
MLQALVDKKKVVVTEVAIIELLWLDDAKGVDCCPKRRFLQIKKVNDVPRLQALVDKKKVIITEATIRDALRLADAEGINCLPNEEIFIELARMGAKRTSWNKFSSSMDSAVICLSTGRKFNFSKYIFDSLVRNVDSSTKFYMYPRFLQLMIRVQVGDLSSHTTKYSFAALTQKVFENMRMVGKGCSAVETPLFEGMIIAQQVDESAAEVNVDDISAAGVTNEGAASVADDDVPAAIDEPSFPLPTPPTQPPPPSQDVPSTSQVQLTPPQSPQFHPPSPQQQPHPLQDADISMNLLHNLLDTFKIEGKEIGEKNELKVLKLRRLKKVGIAQRVETFDDTVMDDVSKQGRIIADMDAGVDVTLKDIAKDVVVDAEIGKNDEVEPIELQEVVEVVTTAKLITEVVTAVSATITAAAPTLTTAPNADEHVEDVSAGDAAHGDDSAAHGEVLLLLKNHPYHLLNHLLHHHNNLIISFQNLRRVEHLAYDKVVQALEIIKLKRRVKKLEKREQGNKVRVLKLRRLQKVGTSQRVDTSNDIVMDDESNQGRMIAEIDKDDAVVLMDDKEEDKKVEEAKEDKTKPAEVQEVVDVVTTAKLITKVVTAANETITAANADEHVKDVSAGDAAYGDDSAAHGEVPPVTQEPSIPSPKPPTPPPQPPHNLLSKS